MSNTRQLYSERLSTIQKAIALQPIDRVPVVVLNDMFAPAQMGVKMSDFVSDIALSNKTIIDSAVALGVDGIQLSMEDPRFLSALWLTRMKIPGVDMPDNALWQADERELMTIADYDVIIDKGWNYFFRDFATNRLDNLLSRLAKSSAYGPISMKNCEEAGLVVVRGGHVTPPLEMISGGRSMNKFYTDLYKIPDKVQAAFDVAMEDIIANAATILATKPLGVWVGGWRGASSFMKPTLWQRFVWPYMKRLAEVVIEAGVVPIFHLDANWERDMEFFKELPAGKCLMYPDGQTNIFKIKEVLGDHMCINGDVPPQLLTLGTPEEVYDYSRKLVKGIGPTGFIMGQGCDIPWGSKLENVQAMVAAAKDGWS